MKTIKVTNKTKGVLILSSGANPVLLNPESNLTFTHDEYVQVAHNANTYMNANLVEIAHLDPEGTAPRERIMAAVQPTGEATFTSDVAEEFEPVELTEEEKVAEDAALLQTVNGEANSEVNKKDAIKKQLNDLKAEYKKADPARKEEINAQVSELKEQYNKL